MVLRRWHDDRRTHHLARLITSPVSTPVLLVADDGFGGLSSDNLIITVNDVQPSIHAGDLSPARATTIDEGQSLTLSGSFIDPNPTHSSTVSIDWGDGSPVTSARPGAGSAQFQPALPHTYRRQPHRRQHLPDPVTVTTSDHQSATASTAVTVHERQPHGLRRSARAPRRSRERRSHAQRHHRRPRRARFAHRRHHLGRRARSGDDDARPARRPARLHGHPPLLDDSGPRGRPTHLDHVTDKDEVPERRECRGDGRQHPSRGQADGLLRRVIRAAHAPVDRDRPGHAATRSRYDWEATNRGVTVATGTAATFSFATSPNASYIVTLTVTDNSGGVGTTSVIVVIGTPNPDLITIDPAGAGQVTITSDGTIIRPVQRQHGHGLRQGAATTASSPTQP